MNQKPHHIALKVRDLEQCARFYTGVLDLQITVRNLAEDGTTRSLWFDLGGVILMLERSEEGVAAVESSSSSGPAAAGWHLLALTITPESRAAWRERLCRAGVEITGETPYSLYFSDPENNRLALSHYPEPAPGE